MPNSTTIESSSPLGCFWPLFFEGGAGGRGGGGACTRLYNQNPFFTTRIPTSQPTSFSGIPTLQPVAKAS